MKYIKLQKLILDRNTEQTKLVEHDIMYLMVLKPYYWKKSIRWVSSYNPKL